MPFDAPVGKHRVPYDQSFNVADALTRMPDSDEDYKDLLESQVDRLAKLQRKLYAHDRFSILLVFQAMDAAGKDSTIRAILSGVNPAGCQVTAFKKPSDNELDHDFLWRTTLALPQRGRIGVFNRSHYEEVLVVRVRPKILQYQKLPFPIDLNTIWEERMQSIVEHERHLARNGTIVLKFWLNVSREEQHRRFEARLDNPEKNWKFSDADLDESERWPAYMQAYEAALNATSKPWAPWYAIPADSKRYMRYRVAKTVADTLASLPIDFPKPEEDFDKHLASYRSRLLQVD